MKSTTPRWNTNFKLYGLRVVFFRNDSHFNGWEGPHILQRGLVWMHFSASNSFHIHFTTGIWNRRHKTNTLLVIEFGRFAWKPLLTTCICPMPNVTCQRKAASGDQVLPGDLITAVNGHRDLKSMNASLADGTPFLTLQMLRILFCTAFGYMQLRQGQLQTLSRIVYTHRQRNRKDKRRTSLITQGSND